MSESAGPSLGKPRARPKPPLRHVASASWSQPGSVSPDKGPAESENKCTVCHVKGICKSLGDTQGQQTQSRYCWEVSPRGSCVPVRV